MPSGPNSGPIDDRAPEEVDSSGSDDEPAGDEIVFGEDASFEPRDCSHTIRWEGGGDVVRLAGEFTDWATSPLSMTTSGSVHEITLAPGPNLVGGTMYAYKIVVDGEWRLDPNNRYRKLLGGQMNSAFVLPACDAGPELLAGRVSVSGDAMKVRVRVHRAATGAPPERVSVRLDKKAVAASTFVVDAARGAIDFSFQGLTRGKHTLSLRAVDGQGREAEPIDLPFWVEDEPFDARDGLLYMLLVDRFANGDVSNDAPVRGPVHYDADFHGGDLNGALAVMKSGYFEELGVRTIWLSPLNTQTSRWHTGDGGQIFSAYHGYWPVKAREVEPRFGGGPALAAFVEEAHRRGIRVLLDLINNQVHDDHEYVSSHPEWFRKTCQCGDDANGCGWSVRPFDCLFQQYLPDIDWTDPRAEKRFIADAVHWIEAYDLDGFRVDAVKHVEANSIYNLRAELSRRFEQGGARIWMLGETAVGEGDRGTFFGETFRDGYDWIEAYTGPTALDGQFDFPTRHAMADGLVNGEMPLDEIERSLERAEARYSPESRHVRFLNGHDNPRIASIAAKDSKLGCRWAEGCRDEQLPPLAYSTPAVYERLERALTVLYTLPGIPFLYQGDEVAFGGGADPDMRRDMLFGGELTALEMSRPGRARATLTAAQIGLRAHARKLGAVRTESRAVRRGERTTLLAEPDLWVYAYQVAPKEIAIVAVNRGDVVSSRTIPASALSLGAVSEWQSALGNGSMTMPEDGLVLSLGKGEAAIFLAR